MLSCCTACRETSRTVITLVVCYLDIDTHWHFLSHNNTLFLHRLCVVCRFDKEKPLSRYDGDMCVCMFVYWCKSENKREADHHLSGLHHLSSITCLTLGLVLIPLLKREVIYLDWWMNMVQLWAVGCWSNAQSSGGNVAICCRQYSSTWW